jgi:hypothetical protein
VIALAPHRVGGLERGHCLQERVCPPTRLRRVQVGQWDQRELACLQRHGLASPRTSVDHGDGAVARGLEKLTGRRREHEPLEARPDPHLRDQLVELRRRSPTPLRQADRSLTRVRGHAVKF